MNSTFVHPLFTYAGDAFDNDFDIGILSEYLFEDERNMQTSSVDTKHTFTTVGNTDSSVFSMEEGYSSQDELDFKRRKSTFDEKGDQVGRRRERNRVLARKTRLRKKFFFESLQRQVAQLAVENEKLKGIVKQKLDGETQNQILSDCSTELPQVVAASAERATISLEKSDFGLMTAIQAAQRSFCITDPSLPDNPIVFASQGFLDLSGYSLNEVLGRNCRFLQGPGTDLSQIDVLRNGIMNGVDTTVCLLNYKADGTPFYNQIFVAGLRDSSHKIINYVGVQVEVKIPLPNISEIDHQENVIKGEDDMIMSSKPQLKQKKVVPKVSSSTNIKNTLLNDGNRTTVPNHVSASSLAQKSNAFVHIPTQYVPGGRLPGHPSRITRSDDSRE